MDEVLAEATRSTANNVEEQQKQTTLVDQDVPNTGPKTTSNKGRSTSFRDGQDNETIRKQLVSRAIEEVLCIPATEGAEEPTPANVVKDDTPLEVQPFDVLVSLAQTMAISQHAGNKLLMTFCYQAAPHFAKCQDERQKFTMAEQLLTKMQNDLGTRFIWESSHLPTPMELAITATCILVDLMPTQHDVVFTSTGSLVPEHSGNEFFVMLCQAFLIRMDDTSNTVTLDFIVSEMAKLLPPGRFLLAHTSEFKFTPLKTDQQQCFILRQILEQDRSNYRRAVSPASHPDSLEQATIITGSRRSSATTECNRENSELIADLLERKQKRTRATHEQDQQRTTDKETLEECTDRELGPAEEKKQKIKAIVFGKRQSIPKISVPKKKVTPTKATKSIKAKVSKLKVAAMPQSVSKPSDSTVKSSATPQHRRTTSTKATADLSPEPRKTSLPNAKAISPTTKLDDNDTKLVQAKGGIRVIYPSSPPSACADTLSGSKPFATSSTKVDPTVSEPPSSAVPRCASSNTKLFSSPNASSSTEPDTLVSRDK